MSHDDDIARGVAHNINNVLASIIGNISVARATLPAGNPALGRLDAAERAAFRLQDLTERLQLYAARIEPIRFPVSIEQLVTDSLARVGLDCERMLTPGLTVEGDAGLLTRVLLEMLTNAAEAGAGQVSIAASEVDGELILQIADDGPGVDASMLTRLFEPFVSTRSGGRGLGLPIVASLMRLHGGSVRYHAHDDGGAVFTLRMPGCRIQPVSTEPELRRVLVMDDEEALREILGDMIRLLGHEVEAVGSGDVAMERFTHGLRSGRPFSLVVLDLVVPGGVGGAAVLSQMRALSPGVRAVVSSGYWAEATGHLGSGGFQAALIKPFTLSDVKAAVEEALDDGTAR